MNIVVYGTGAVGGYFGSRLVEAGENVTFIARGKQLETIKSKGLKLFSPLGNYHVNPVKATANFSEVSEVDLILIAVKTWQLIEVAEAIKPNLKPGTHVISLLNGVENHIVLEKILGKTPVLGGLCKVVCRTEGYGSIRHDSYTPEIVFGELNHEISERSLKIQKIFNGAGIQNKLSTDIHKDMWTKFLYISTISALGALTRATIGEMLEYSEVRNIMKQIAVEIETIARAKGIDLAPDILKKQFIIIELQPYNTTSSLQRDIMNRKPSELEAQNGVVIRMGKSIGIPTPYNSFVYHSLLIQERQSRAIK